LNPSFPNRLQSLRQLNTHITGNQSQGINSITRK
jgi:hypothetical protein